MPPLPSVSRVSLFAAAALLAAAAPAAARQVAGADDGDEPRVFVIDRAAERQLRLAERALGDDRPGDAVALARLSLERGADGVLADGRPVSVAAAALLNGLTPRQRTELELAAGAEAAAALDAALAARDRAALADVAVRFPGTAAGVRAAAAAADGDLDRGEFAAAARRFAALAELPFPPAADRDRWRVKRAAALARDGRPAAARAALAELPADRLAAAATALFGPADGLTAAPADADALLARLSGPAGGTAGGWPLVGRTPARLPAAPGVAPPPAANLVGGPAWSEGTLGDVPPNALDGGPDDVLRRLRIDRAAGGAGVRPVAEPLTVGGAVLASTPGGVVARDAATGTLLWKAPAGADAALALATGGENPAAVAAATRDGVFTGTHMLVEQAAFVDAASGSLAADDERVYSLQNLDLPKLSADDALAAVAGPGRGGMMGGRFGQGRRDRVNRLRAHDLRTGRLLWSVGGPAGDRADGRVAEPLAGGFFLAPPLPTARGLGVLQERGGLVTVLTLDPATGGLRRAVPLAVPAAPLYDPPAWRTAGAHLAAAAGLWVAPTNAGGVAALDPLSGRLAWTYRYAGTTLTEITRRRGVLIPGDPAGGGPGWSGPPATIAAGRVLLTPADSEELHCLSLDDGAKLWTRPRGDAREVAGVAGPGGDAVALLVGDDGVRGVGLDDGAERWFTPLPPAAGSAVVAGDVLVVPLADDTLASVRTDGGGVVARAGAGGAAGNLVAAGGRLVSQTADGLSAFATAAELEATLRTAGADPAARLLRAGLAAQAGDPAAAVDELIAAAGAGGDLAERANDKLRTLLAGGLRRDFGKFRPLLDRATETAGGPAAGELARALAAGLADSGDPAGAFRALAELRDEPGDAKPRRTARFVAADAFARPRLPGLFAAAGPADRPALAGAVTGAAAALDPADADATARFARRFGPLTRSDAWGELGNGDPVTAALLAAAGAAGEPGAAERLLLWAADRDPAAVPDARFAALYAAAGSPAAAAFFGEPADPPWAGRAFAAGPAGDGPRLYREAVIPVETWPAWGVGGRLTAGEADAALRWRTPDAAVGFTHPLRGRVGGTDNRAAFAGHLLAVATAGRLLALDTLAKPGAAGELWTARLAAAPPRRGRFSPDRGGSGGLDSPNAGAATRDGPIAVGPRQIVVRDSATLAARDARTGDVLWVRPDVPAGSAVWGDDAVILVHPPGERRVRRLRADDGERLPPVEAPPGGAWLRRGTRVWTLAGDPDADADRGGDLTLRCVDLAPADPSDPADLADTGDSAEVWARTFPAGTRVSLGDACREVAALTPAGRLAVIDVTTGEDALAADLPADPPAAAVRAVRSPLGVGRAGRRTGGGSRERAAAPPVRPAGPRHRVRLRGRAAGPRGAVRRPAGGARLVPPRGRRRRPRLAAAGGPAAGPRRRAGLPAGRDPADPPGDAAGPRPPHRPGGGGPGRPRLRGPVPLGGRPRLGRRRPAADAVRRLRPRPRRPPARRPRPPRPRRPHRGPPARRRRRVLTAAPSRRGRR